jgi:hypothetical protein
LAVGRGAIGSALHLIAASSAVVLLVLFEIFKETIIKPVLKTGVKEFQSEKYAGLREAKQAAVPGGEVEKPVVAPSKVDRRNDDPV